MADTYTYHRILTAPRQWQAVATALSDGGAARLSAVGGALYGVWRSQIGRPRDEPTVMTQWPDGDQAGQAATMLLQGVGDVAGCDTDVMTPTLRPETSASPRRQGNFAFRWFETPNEHWPEFLDLCAGAWPNFEGSYDSQVIGLWRCLEDAPSGGCRSLLLTRRPDLAMWERSKIPQGEVEAEVRRKLSRRYDLCDDTWVYTTTLLTAEDQADDVRWT